MYTTVSRPHWDAIQFEDQDCDRVIFVMNPMKTGSQSGVLVEFLNASTGAVVLDRAAMHQ